MASQRRLIASKVGKGYCTPVTIDKTVYKSVKFENCSSHHFDRVASRKNGLKRTDGPWVVYGLSDERKASFGGCLQQALWWESTESQAIVSASVR